MNTKTIEVNQSPIGFHLFPPMVLGEPRHCHPSSVAWLAFFIQAED